MNAAWTALGSTPLKRWYAELRRRYAGLATRERGLIVAACLGVTGFVWDLSLNQSLTEEGLSQKQKLAAADQQLRGARETVARLQASGPNQELSALRSAVTARTREVHSVEERIRRHIDGFVPAAETERLLAGVLAHHPGLRLVSADVLPAAPLLIRAASARNDGDTAMVSDPSEAPQRASDASSVASAAPAVATASARSALFRHGMRLELAGSYLDAQRYLSELEALPWGLAWDRVEYQVETHPNGRLVLELHTISQRREWGGAEPDSR